MAKRPNQKSNSSFSFSDLIADSDTGKKLLQRVETWRDKKKKSKGRREAFNVRVMA